jgi:hypothetical protein
MVPTLEEYPSMPATLSFRPLTGWVSSKGSSPLRMVDSIGHAVSGVITPSSSPAPKTIALCTDPGSTTKLVAASLRSSASYFFQSAASYVG